MPQKFTAGGIRPAPFSPGWLSRSAAPLGRRRVAPGWPAAHPPAGQPARARHHRRRHSLCSVGRCVRASCV
jgi:hypothetical protein